MKTTALKIAALACIAQVQLAALAHAASVVSQWTLEETSSPYADSVGTNTLTQNPSTSTAASVPNSSPIGTNSTQLLYADPGPSTSLSAGGSFNSTLQQNSFGFSFWINPVYLNAGDFFLGKEIAETGTGENFEKISWSVSLLGGDGDFKQVEFLVRGDDRSLGKNFYGSVLSSVSLELRTDTPDWINIAGGYDAFTGEMSIYIGGIGVTEFRDPFASSTDGSPIFVGTGFNGSTPVAFSANTLMWDLRIYDDRLTQSEVDSIIAAVPEPSSLLLLALGAGVAVVAVRARHRKPAAAGNP